MYTPGKGAIVPAVLGAATGTLAVVTLPKTGSGLINDVALAVAVALVGWAVAYLRLRRKAN